MLPPTAITTLLRRFYHLEGEVCLSVVYDFASDLFICINVSQLGSNLLRPSHGLLILTPLDWGLQARADSGSATVKR